MSGLQNKIVYSEGSKITPSSAESITNMQQNSTDIADINYTGNPEGAVSANPGSFCRDPVSGNIYSKASGTGNTGWILSSPASGSVIITKYETAGSFTWTKNPNAKTVTAIGWSGGSGGGSGARGAIGQSLGGGAGGTGPGCFRYDFLAANLGATETVVVGAGGAGGAAVTADDTDGNNGVTGGFSAFAHISTVDLSFFPFVLATPAGLSAGAGGANNDNPTGGTSGPIVTNNSIQVITLRGGDSNLFTNPVDADSVPNTFARFGIASVETNAVYPSYLCNLGGGGAGGIDNVTLNVATNAGSFLSTQDGSVLKAGGAAGVTGVSNGDGANGIDGSPVVSGGILFGGTGGGGGAPNFAGIGGKGGNGGKYGAGGGGGAASNNGFNSGAGGHGGDGAVIVIEYLS